MAFRLVDDRFAVDLDSRRDGGMGAVYRATDLTSGQSCAVKTLDVARQRSQLHELAMRRELEALSSLTYAHIVPLLGYGLDERLGRYLAIQWLSEDLRDRCARAPFQNWGKYWLEVGQPILAALCYALTKGRTHRDVTPGNIMFNEHGIAFLIDFGISGIEGNPSFGATLRHQKTPIYAPPEENPRDAVRDVYGFAATTVFALTGATITSRQQLLDALDQLKLANGVRRVLASCLLDDPDDRPASVIVLREKLERESRDGISAALESKNVIFLKLSRNAENQLRALSESPPITSLLEALNGTTYVERPRIGGADSERISLVTASISILAVQDRENRSVLNAIAAYETRPTHWAFSQERSLKAVSTFRDAGSAGRIENSFQAISDLFAALAEHEAVAGITEDSSIFEVWRTVLRGRMDYYGMKFPSLLPTDISVDGMRITVELATAPDPNLVGLSYFVEDGISRVAVGEVESVQDEGLTLYCTANFDPEAVRAAGRLRYNAAGTERAIRHQEAALDSIQAGTTPNLCLAAIVSDPSRTPAPKPFNYTPILTHLDEDKQSAAKAALGSEAAFLIVGPPGVGKTELITELVLQEIKREPSIRILLSAQTHMAVDNALSRVKELQPNVSCVRLGRPSEKISSTSGEFLLERIAAEWRSRVTERSLAALDRYSADRGVDVAFLRSKRSAEKAHMAAQEVAKCLVDIDSITQRLIALRESQENVNDTHEEIDDLEEELLEKKDSLSQLELRRTEAEAEVWSAGVNAANLLEALKEGRNVSTGLMDTIHEDVGKILTITSEWRQRLAIAEEFFPVILAESQLVAGTCLGFIGAPGTDEIVYDVAIIEEASRALPTEVLVPASRARRMVLVGDEKQLPPFLESELLSPEWLEANSLTRHEVKETLFGRLAARLPPSAVATLKVQYRMIPAIGNMVAEVFYPRTLTSFPSAGEKALKLTQLDFERNVCFLSTSRMSNRREAEIGSGYTNPAEVEVARRILLDLLKRTRKKKRGKFSVVLLSPYVAQRNAIEQAIAGLRSSYGDADISSHTVHTFQGREADIAIFSCVRSNTKSELGFTRDPRLLNVALSRGRGGLIVVGDIDFLSGKESSPSYRDLIAYMRSHPDTCSVKDGRHVG